MKPWKLLAAISVLLFLTASVRAELIERVIVKVNGDIVTLTEFEARQAVAVQQARIRPDAIPAFLRENNARLLQDAIDDLLLVQRAQELGMRMREEYANEIIDNIKKENNITNDEDFRQQLRREGLTLDGLRRNIERSIMRRQVLARDVESKAAVSEEEVRAQYEARRTELTRPETVRLRQILLTGDDAAARAADVVTRARAGEDFADLARTYAQDGSGGLLGTFTRGEMTPDLERITFALKAGEVSDPIADAAGVRILRVEERNDGGLVPFDEVKDQIREQLGQDRWAKVYQEFIEGLRKTALIDVKVREVPLQLGTPATTTVFDSGIANEEGPSAAGREPTPGVPDAEIVTTPQNKPERVAPPSRPSNPKGEEKKPDGQSSDESVPRPDGSG